jgi:tetratricopeptide (TPR) repeat protein
MGKISLRAYNHEIETLIERGHTEEAIAHCKYILKTYPKHLDTYRLLGKAFLESQRYSEAADILQRILSVLPDDFVAQIGMSIIREDEGNLDAAIYHMERAFEIQPSNAAIQDELRRLYGRRDGIEPSKLRLTRGALVRMYARGDLYRQAIAEARAAIVEDPQRLDLEIVLARMYSHTGQKAEAAEICSRLVSKLPYCLEANRILAEVLPETSRAEDAKIYQQRLVALDPYLPYLSDTTVDVRQVQDNAVTLDRLEWVPSLETDQQPTWAKSLGLQIVEKEDTEKVPDWMTELPASAEQPEEEEKEPSAKPFTEEPDLYEKENEPLGPIPEDVAAPSADLPEWMQSIGWSISGQPAQANPPEPAPTDLFSEESEKPAAPAEIPDWLKDIAPSEQPSAPSSPEDQQNLDWLASILPSESSASTDTGLVSESLPAETSAPQPQLLIQEPETQQTISDDLPDWLKSGPSGTDEPLFVDQSQEPLPDWLTESVKLHAEPTVAEETTAPVNALPEEPAATVEDTHPIRVHENPESVVENPPEAEDLTPASESGVTAPDMGMGGEDAMSWLESLAARQGADESTLLTRPEDRAETPPEWVSQAFETVQPVAAVPETPFTPVSADVQTPEAEISSEPVIATGQAEAVLSPLAEIPSQPADETGQAEVATIPAAEIPPQTTFESTTTEAEAVLSQESPEAALEPTPPVEPVQPEAAEEPTFVSELTPETVSPASETTPTEGADLDAAFAWLESLAAKHGADADSLLVAPEERQDTAPDWIQQQTPTEQPLPAEPAEVVPPPAAPGDHIADWIIHTEEAPVTGEPSGAEESTLPDWLKQVESSPEASLVTPAPEEGVSPAIDQPIEPSVLPESEKAGIDWFQEFNDTTSEKPAILASEAEKPAEDQSPAPETSPLPVTRELGKTRPLPSWLAGGPAQPPAVAAPTQPQEQPLPDWLQQPDQPVETPPLEHAAETPAAAPSELPDWMQSVVQPVENQPFEPAAGLPAAETPELPDWLKSLESEPQEALPGEPVMSLPSEPAPATFEVSSNPDEMIGQAQSALSKGQVDLALSIYNQLIPQAQHLDETIHDLRDALYRFPVESSIWQTLGDACMRNNRLQEALDAYTKAEELLK